MLLLKLNLRPGAWFWCLTFIPPEIILQVQILDYWGKGKAYIRLKVLEKNKRNMKLYNLKEY